MLGLREASTRRRDRGARILHDNGTYREEFEQAIPRPVGVPPIYTHSDQAEPEESESPLGRVVADTDVQRNHLAGDAAREDVIITR